MGVKPGRWHWGRNAGWGCLRIGCWEYLDLRGTRWQGNGESCITRSWMICTPYPLLCGWYNRDEWDGQGMWRVWGRIELCKGCWWGSLRERDHWGNQDVDGRIILRWIFRKLKGVMGTGWSWLRIGTGGRHLWVQWGTFGFHKCGEFLD